MLNMPRAAFISFCGKCDFEGEYDNAFLTRSPEVPWEPSGSLHSWARNVRLPQWGLWICV